jgi:phosphoribosylglycinamide formyltransferase-1
MHLLAPAFVARFPQLLNIHPSFLPFDGAAETVVMPDGSSVPAIRGAHAVRDALAAKLAWSGATVHRVTNETDRGEIVVRTPFTLDDVVDDATFVRKLRPIEHAAIVSAIRRWAFESEG